MQRQFLELFRGLDTAYGVYEETGRVKQRETGSKKAGRGTTVRGQLTEEHWRQHLAGEISIGVVPIQLDGSCWWGAIDIDDYILDFKSMEAKIAEHVLPLTLCRTKSGGAHLYLFVSEPVPARVIRQKLGDWAVALGYPEVEIFPKQDELAGEDDVGNWLNMPYHGGTPLERYAIYKGEPLQDPQDFLALAHARRVSAEVLEQVQPVGGALSDGPPCLQTMALHGVPEGGRNETLFAMGVYAKMKYGDQWESALNDLNNEHMHPPLGFQEVGDIAKSLKRKEYAYTCKKQPLSRYCNREICRQRSFGISAASGPEDPGVMIDHLTQLLSDPPLWFVTVNGIRMKLQTDDLLSQARFAKRCVEHLRFFPNQLKSAKWQQLVNQLLQNAEVVEVPQDSGAAGQFRVLLEQFCTGAQQGRDWEDLLRGMPFTEEGRTYFRGVDLTKFLQNQGFRDLSRNEVWSELRDMGAKHGQKNIKGKCVQHWSVPAQQEQVEEFTPPRTEAPEF